MLSLQADKFILGTLILTFVRSIAQELQISRIDQNPRELNNSTSEIGETGDEENGKDGFNAEEFGNINSSGFRRGSKSLKISEKNSELKRLISREVAFVAGSKEKY